MMVGYSRLCCPQLIIQAYISHFLIVLLHAYEGLASMFECEQFPKAIGTSKLPVESCKARFKYTICQHCFVLLFPKYS